jgi:hypothetical protein
MYSTRNQQDLVSPTMRPVSAPNMVTTSNTLPVSSRLFIGRLRTWQAQVAGTTVNDKWKVTDGDKVVVTSGSNKCQRKVSATGVSDKRNNR